MFLIYDTTTVKDGFASMTTLKLQIFENVPHMWYDDGKK